MDFVDDHVAALRAEPESDEVAERLRLDARKEGRFETLAESLIERGDRLLSRNEQAKAVDAYIEAALVYEEDLSDLTRAAQCCERVLEIDAGHRQALFTLGLLLHDLGQWEELIALYRRRIRQAEDPGEQTTFHMYVAEILEQRLDDSNAAFEEVMAAARLAPQNIRIVTRLQRLGDETQRLEEVAVSIGNLILHQEDPRVRAALSLRLAELHLGPLNDDNRALAYLRAALADDGGNPTVLHEVQDVFRERDRFDALAALLEQSVKDRRIGPHRVRLERELARIYERELSDPERALGALTRAAEHAEGDRELLDEIMRLGAKTKEFDRVAATFAGVIERTDNLLLKTYLRLKLAQIFATELHRPQSAAEIYEAVLRDDPGHAEARRRLAQLKLLPTAARGADGRLTADLQLDAAALPPMPTIASAEPPPSGAPLEPRASHVSQTQVAPVSPAPEATAWPEHPEGHDLSSVAELELVEDSALVIASDEAPTEFVGQSYGPETETQVAARMSALAAQRSAEARAKEAELAEGSDGRLVGLQRELKEAARVDDVERVEALLAEVYKINRELGEDERAFFALVRLIKIEPTEARLDELFDLGRHTESYGLTLETVDEALSALSRDNYVRFQLLAAEIESEDLSDPDLALERLAATYQHTDGDPDVREGWLALLEQQGRFDEMAQLLAGAARRERDSAEAERLILRAAAVRTEHEDDPVGAAAILQQYLEASPERDAIRERAVELLERAEKWEALSHQLDGMIERREEAERAPIRLRKARIQIEKLEDLDGAEVTIRRGLEERARDGALLEALSSILERRGRHDELLGVLIRRAEGLASPETRRNLRLKAAQIAEQQLSDPQKALEILSPTLAEDPSNPEILASLERLRRSMGDWRGVRTILEARAASEQSPEVLAGLHTEIAELAVSRDGELDAASRALARALEVAPAYVPALLLWAEVAERRGDVQDAIRVLRQLTAVEDPEAQSEGHLRIGLLLETCMGDPEGARAEYQAAHAADPSRPEALSALLEATERAQEWAQAQELAERAAELADDPREAASFWRRAGQIAKERLLDEARALGCYANVLRADPDDLDTQATIGLVYLGRREFELAHMHLWAAASALSDPERATELFFAAADAAKHLAREDGVIAALEAVLERAPHNRNALERLRVRRIAAEDWERAYELGAHLIVHHEEQLTALERSTVYADMAHARLGQENAAAALKLARRAHELDAQTARPLALMADAWVGVGEPLEASTCLKEWSTRLEDPQARKDALLRAARLAAHDGDDAARAAGLVAEAHAISRDDVEIALLLSTHRAAIGDTLGAADALMTTAQLKEGHARADLLVEAARVVLGGGRDRARVKRLLEEALELAPGHAEALHDLSILLEFDGAYRALADVLQRSAEVLDSADGEGEVSSARERARALRQEALDICRERLADPVTAVELGRKLGHDKATDPVVRERFARLLDEAIADGRGDQEELQRAAIELWASLVEEDPGHIEGLDRLRALGSHAGDRQTVRVAEELLVAVGAQPINGLIQKDEFAEVDSVDALRVPEDPAEKTGAGPLLDALGHAPLLAFQDEARYPRLRKKDAVSEDVLGVDVARPLAFATSLVGIPSPLLFTVDEAHEPFTPALVGDQPALMVSLPATESLGAAELRFFAGRALSLLRPRALSVVSLPAPLIREALVGLGNLANAQALFVDPKVARRRARALERQLASAVHDTLVGYAQRYFEDEGAPGVAAARAAVLRTADRVGLVASGSVLSALGAMAGGLDAPALRERRPPLIRFAASREYADLARRLPERAE